MKPCIALTKGRLEKQFLEYFQSLGFDIQPLVKKGRKLRVDTEDFQFVFAKGVDVTTYVEHGIADLGIVGEDVLTEFQPDVFNLLPLPFGQCRMALAAEAGGKWPERKRKIASKYPNITKEFFRLKGESVDIVKLEGSVELAPILGLADGIVDIVETGTTLKENGLIIKEEFHQYTARCIANRSSLKIKKDCLTPLIEALQKGEAVT
ncbi:ATP phosphoribosyltransferase [Sediminibacillus albus]|uniref:ATP phosphoribosyltransferase n=1 Tax=Sediminibacillus albus TaxID=407036 RepID=A0A1G8VUP8_9BACI|nr:ATP phosphoribosyltransferase [Sediminibacillus albus]SDJ69798.1 ATP phosphoribosyltransferase [Sediminibacillus albus]